ncbi:hypothetical protein [Actinospica robiniae]|uniref:hypothetical protein n=1 Tax=Actinospica robiniae TaxID=304901 RepID=UPI000428AAF1|nr:hypothetical protein [Actinospica robiniae]
MIRTGKKARRLLVGDEVFLWSVRHEHLANPSDSTAGRYQDCREILVLRRHGTHGRLLITFRQGAGRSVPDGIGPGGVVGTADGRHLNLNEPGAARAVLDEAEARGISIGDAVIELDGWEFYDAAVARIESRRSAANQQ